MPKAQAQANTQTTQTERIGKPTKAFAMLPSEFLESEFADDAASFVIVVPDIGDSAFVPYHKDKAGKDVKAKFIVLDEKATGGRGVAPVILHDRNGEPVLIDTLDGDKPQVLMMSNGEHQDIELGFSLYMQAIPANTKGVTVDEALNRKVETGLKAVAA